MRGEIIALLLAAAVVVSLIAVMPATAIVSSRTYTVDADFDEGVLVGAEHVTVHNQLQLNQTATTLPFIWVPNQEGTVSKIDTETGDELGRYWISPPGLGSTEPSRTTVDLEGNCWVGVRNAGTVVKIGLFEAGNWVDRNGDGVCQTSNDTNDDGDITGSEILGWGADECILHEIFLKSGVEATRVPGATPHTSADYDTGHWSTSPRALAIDADNNLWTAKYQPAKYFYVDGDNGAILRSVDIESDCSDGPYGAVIDSNGILWTSGRGTNKLLRLDPADDSTSELDLGHFSYGLGLDGNNHLFVSGWSDCKLSRINITTGTKDWTKSAPTQARGVTCTSDGDVWVASTSEDKVYRYDNDGNLKAEIPVGNGPTGVAIDSNGKVWSCNLDDNNVKRTDPTTNSVDLTKSVSGSTGHYSYSDMTGIIARTVTTKLGTWNVVFDSEEDDIQWGTVSWNDQVPAGTSVTVKVRSSNDQIVWFSWEDVTNGVALSSTPDGRYLQIETTLKITSGDVSPILYDLTVEVETTGPVNQPPVADAGPDQYIETTGPGDVSVTLDGSGSTDDGLIQQPLEYAWAWSGGSATGVGPTITRPMGTTRVILTVFDGQYYDASTVTIRVRDPLTAVPALTAVPVMSPIGIIALISVLGFIGAGVISRRR